MTASVPWSVSAVDPEAWATARDAARRAGLSVGEWLESAIRESAHERARASRPAARDSSPIDQRLDDISERIDHLARRADPPAATIRETRREQALLDSIEALNDRMDELARDMRADTRGGPIELRAAIQRLDDRIEDLIARGRLAGAGATPEIERKLEDIARTMESMGRRLEQENARYAASPPPSSIDELDAAVADIMMRQSALDGVPPPRDLRRAPPPAGADFAKLEHQLKVMTDEMQALRRAGIQSENFDAMRHEIAALTARFAELAPRRSLESIERAVESLARRFDRASSGRSDETMTEVVQALHDIRGALAEVRPAESFTAVEKDLHELSSKLDGLSSHGMDMSTMARLQEQTAEIRDLLSSALPSDVLKALVEQIELLVRKFEGGRAAPDTEIVDVMAAFDRRIEALSERIDAAGRQGPGQAALDDIRARLDELQTSVTRAGQGSSGEVEASLRALSQKVDAAEARLGNLATIERGINELFGRLDEVRANGPAQERMPTRSMREMVATSIEPEKPQALRGEIEFGAGPHLAPRATAVAIEDEASDAGDYPLEPGSGAPRMRLQSAALRVAQSEAALGGIGATASDAQMRTSDFIAAARRAAQAAAAEPGSELAKARDGTPGRGLFAAVGGGRRILLFALAAFLLIFTALRFFDGNLPSLPFSAPATPPGRSSEPAEPVRPEPQAPQNRSSISNPHTDALVSMPPAGVLGGSPDHAFYGDSAIDPAATGTTTTAAGSTKAAIQTAATPPNAALEVATTLPDALGTPALRAAATAGDPIAAYEIGARYLEGRGVRADPVEAVKWLERARSKGSAPAAYRLGNIYEKGHGVAKNSAEATRYYKAAAEAGNIKAMHNLAVLYAEGPDGKPDYRAAAHWFRMAADRGVRDSQYNLGVLYARGLGADQNLAESFRWFALAANQGDTDAAKKRDDVAKRLDVQTLVAAKLAVQTWTATPVDASSNEVRLKPEWEAADATPRKRSVKK
jgi:localization factor PodJL